VERQLISEFDKVLVELENEELFGKGTADDIDVKSKAFENRSKLYDEVKALGSFYYQKGKEVPKLDELIKIAGNATFGDKFNKKGQVSRKLEERSQNLLGKPSPRESIEKTSSDDNSKESKIKEAINGVGQFLKERGLKK
jgi:hypothetical protein